MKAQTISVDFDGTIHPYTKGWTGYTPEDEPPLPGAAEFLQRCVESNLRVVICSCRCDHPNGEGAIWAWLDKHRLSEWVDVVTNVKPPAVAYVDDRAVPLIAGNFDAVFNRVQALRGVRQ